MTTTVTPTVAPLTPLTFELATDDDLRHDLAAVGVELRLQAPDEQTTVLEAVVPDDAAQIDAIASTLLRRIAEHDVDIAQHQRAHEMELEVLAARFERRVATQRIARARLEAWVRDLARVQADAGGFGKKRSRDVGCGTYGVRTIPAKVAVTDADAFVTWAERVAPEMLRVSLKMPLADARQYLTETELAAVRREVFTTPVKDYVKGTGTLPPGVTQTPETTEAYAKPEAIR